MDHPRIPPRKGQVSVQAGLPAEATRSGPPPALVLAEGSEPVAVPAAMRDLRLRPAIAVLEAELITEALTRTGGNRSAAARLLGLSRFGLQKKLRRGGECADAGDDVEA